jgi:hydrogenase 3 maturation protease
MPKNLPSLRNKKTVFLAVGNIMRGDDAFGPMVYCGLKDLAGPCFLPLNGGELPENFTSVIKTFAPEHLIIADAAHISPGSRWKFIILGESDICGAAFSTHALPLDVMIKFIKEDLPDLKIFLIAAPAENMAFGAHPSPRIKAAAKEAAAVMIKALYV